MQDLTTGLRSPVRTADQQFVSEPGRVGVGVGPVSRAELVAVARDGAGVVLTPEAESAIAASRAVVEALADDEVPHYGVSTGFGALANRHIPPGLRAELQRSLVRSHAAGSGAEVEREVVRAMLLLRLSTLATGSAPPAGTPRCSPPGSPLSSASTARWGARATWPRSRRARWR
jgi:hypothetical protein